MAAIDVIFHSGALNPSIQTPWQGSRPSCVMKTKKKKFKQLPDQATSGS